MKQYISELIDDDLSGRQRDDALERLLSDRSAKQSWSHYHLIGQVIRGEVNRAPHNLADRIAERLEAETVVLAPVSTTVRARPSSIERSVLWRSAGLMALAASVVLVAVIVVKPTPVIESAGLVSTNKAGVETAAVRATMDEFQTDMGNMLVEHGEFTSTMGLNGLLAYAKMVSSESVAR